MANENGEWIIHGIGENDPYRIKTIEELEAYIEEIGFMPLFANEIPAFSVEERTFGKDWWSDDELRDPWIWRMKIAGKAEIAYGKFFNRKAGFISLKWLPYFVNARRDGYDFEGYWEDGLATRREKNILDALGDNELMSFELKRRAGFGKNGDKNFEGTITSLQMKMYAVMRDFRMRLNKNGEPYGWSIAVYSTPEHIWGYNKVTEAFNEDPVVSRERIFEHMQKIYPIATEAQIKKVLG